MCPIIFCEKFLKRSGNRGLQVPYLMRPGTPGCIRVGHGKCYQTSHHVVDWSWLEVKGSILPLNGCWSNPNLHLMDCAQHCILANLGEDWAGKVPPGVNINVKPALYQICLLDADLDLNQNFFLNWIAFTQPYNWTGCFFSSLNILQFNPLTIFLLYFRQMLMDERLAVVENRAVNINQVSII